MFCDDDDDDDERDNIVRDIVAFVSQNEPPLDVDVDEEGCCCETATSWSYLANKFEPMKKNQTSK